MTGAAALYGYEFSVYAWIARLALHEKGVPYDWIEVDPFADDVAPEYLALNPFKRVPTFVSGQFSLYETAAITRFVDENFDGPSLQPVAPADRARMTQIMSVIDQDAYWPMVRQVFSHGFFMPRAGEIADPDEVVEGMAKAACVLDALEDLADGSTFLIGDSLTLADIHFAPMISYFCEVSDASDLLHQRPKLWTWWQCMRHRPHVVATRPDLSKIG